MVKITNHGMVKMTHHSLRRIKERVIRGKKEAQETAERALLEGLPREEMTGLLRDWVDVGYYDHGQFGINIIFNCKVYIFSNEMVLITCHNIPGRLHKSAIQQQKKYQERLRG